MSATTIIPLDASFDNVPGEDATAREHFYAYALRNRPHIFGCLQRMPLPTAPAARRVLEVGSGSGAHISLFAAAAPHLVWHPSDLDTSNIWHALQARPNTTAPVTLDAARPLQEWPPVVVEAAGEFAAVLCFNVVHISPWSVTQGLFAAAEKLIAPGGHVCLYGPYLVEGEETVASNLEFDRSLKGRNAEWGLRKLQDVVAVAEKHGFQLAHREQMPANNLFVGLKKV